MHLLTAGMNSPGKVCPHTPILERSNTGRPKGNKVKILALEAPERQGYVIQRQQGRLQFSVAGKTHMSLATKAPLEDG